MNVKQNVYKRRQLRIRELQTRASQRPPLSNPPESSEDKAGEQRSQRHPSLLSDPGDPDSRLEPPSDDPEYVWKLKERELLQGLKSRRTDFGGADDGREHPPRGQAGRRWLAQLWIACLMFVAVVVMFSLEHPLAKRGQNLVVRLLTNELDFAAVAAWYEKTFSGFPSILPAFSPSAKQPATRTSGDWPAFLSPVQGEILIPFDFLQQGITLGTAANARVVAIDEGRIVSVVESDSGDYSVTIQHPGGYRSTYGRLQPVRWVEGDWLEAGDYIGLAASDGAGGGMVYFALMKDKRYIDPAEVVSFD